MTPKRVAAALVLCLFCFAVLGAFVEAAYAQEPSAQNSLKELFTKKREGQGEGPTRTQLTITIAATVIMVAVVRYV